MKKDVKFYLKLFWATFCLSLFTFGGGYVIISFMRKKFVEELCWLEDGEMLNLVAIAQASPGSIAVNGAILIGYRLAGVFGALVTVFATILPPFMIISVISYFYSQFRDNQIVGYVMLGMQAGVAAVIFDVVISMGKDVIKQRNLLFLLLMAGAFISTFFFKVNIAFIIIICGAVGAAYTYYHEKRGEEPAEK